MVANYPNFLNMSIFKEINYHVSVNDLKGILYKAILGDLCVGIATHTTCSLCKKKNENKLIFVIIFVIIYLEIIYRFTELQENRNYLKE